MLYPSQDDEGTGPGTLFGTTPSGHRLLITPTAAAALPSAPGPGSSTTTPWWVYVPEIDEAGCVVDATSPTAALAEALRRGLTPQGNVVYAYALGALHVLGPGPAGPETVADTPGAPPRSAHPRRRRARTTPRDPGEHTP